MGKRWSKIQNFFANVDQSFLIFKRSIMHKTDSELRQFFWEFKNSIQYAFVQFSSIFIELIEFDLAQSIVWVDILHRYQVD